MRLLFATPIARGLSFVTIAAIAWGTGGIVAAILYRTSGLGPIAVSFWRTVIGEALLAAVYLYRRRTAPAARPERKQTPTTRLTVIVVTGAGLALYQTAYYAAVQQSGVAFATLATLGSGPILIALGARLTIGERLGPTGRRTSYRGVRINPGWVAILLAPVGLLLIAGGSTSGTGAGLVLSLVSAAGYAMVTVLHRGMGGGVDPARTTLTGFAVAGVLLAPLAVAEGLLPTRGDTLATVAALGYLGAVATALAYSLFFASLGAVRATTVSVVALAEPLTATVIAVVLLGERPTWTLAGGAAVLLGAVVLLARAESRHAALPVPEAV